MSHLVRRLLLSAVLFSAPLVAGAPAAIDRGTLAEARALLAKAGAHYKRVGRGQALADFTAKKAPFVDRDLSLLCIGPPPDYMVTANGDRPDMVGKSANGLRGTEGRVGLEAKPLGKALWDAAPGKGEGSVEHGWFNASAGKDEPRISFVWKVGNDVCAVGAYNP